MSVLIDGVSSNSSKLNKHDPKIVVDNDSAEQQSGVRISAVDHDEKPPLKSSEVTPWQARWLRVGPLSGLFCICLASSSFLVSLAILIVSDGAPTTAWKYRPAACLAICTAIANQSMRYAACQGVIVAWWTKAIRGSTLERLHRSWQAGFAVRGAIGAGLKTGLLGLATIFSFIVAIDGPLLQQASTVVSATVSLNVTIAPEIPTNWTGFYQTSISTPDGWNKTIPTSHGSMLNDIMASSNYPDFDHIVAQWLRDTSMSGFIKGCPGKCNARVLAPALSVQSCTTRNAPLTWTSPWRPTSGTGQNYTAPLSQMALSISTNTLLDGSILKSREKIDLVTGYAVSSDCAGNFTYTACTLESAIGEYDVTVIGEENVEINGPPLIREIANNTVITVPSSDNGQIIYPSTDGFHDSTLGGIVWAFGIKWSTLCYFYEEGNATSITIESSPICDGFEVPVEGQPPLPYCPSYHDPQATVLNDFNNLMFRVGAYAGMHRNGSTSHAPTETLLEPGLSINHTVIGTGVGVQEVYRTDFDFFIAAAIVEIVCIALILPTYWEFWKLGRAVSFSPLEIAKAFEAPLLRDCHPNSTGNDIAKKMGSTEVFYGPSGIVEASDGAEKLIRIQTSSTLRSKIVERFFKQNK